MTYVFDSGPLITIFDNYYPETFPSFWSKFNQHIQDSRIVSVRAVRGELKERGDALSDFVGKHNIFSTPTNEETDFVATIFKVRHFMALINRASRLKGKEVADPYVIAHAKIISGCVVTQERYKPNAAKIPNVCERFDIDCLSLKEFMKREGWVF